MTKRRKYQDIKVSKFVNISSSGHYHFQVSWVGGGRDYSLGVGFLANTDYGFSWSGAPKYLDDEVEYQIAVMFQNKTAKFYEYDRDGNERYENLRYRNPEYEATFASRRLSR